MGEYTQHGYGPRDKMEAFWNKPLYGTVSREKALNAAYWVFAVGGVVSLAIRVYLG